MVNFPSNTKEIIDNIRETIGRPFSIYTEEIYGACPLCSLDPTTNKSTDPFCSGCNGSYWLTTLSEHVYDGHIRWKYAGQPYWVSGGVIDDGDCTVTVTYSSGILNTINNSKYFVVDGKNLYLKNYALRGVQDVNRIRITLIEDPAGV